MLDDTGTRIYPIVRIKQYRFEGKGDVHGEFPLLHAANKF